MRQSARVDYYRATTTDIELIIDATKGYFNAEQTEQVKIPLYGYRTTLQTRDSGAFYCASPHTENMGNLVQFSGSPISFIMAQTGLSSVRSIVATHCHNWKVTRLDVAIDVFDDLMTMDEIKEGLDGGGYKSRIRVWEREHELAEHGKDIIRGGGKGAKKSLKIYDKAAEQKLDINWRRYEMTFMDERAREVWLQIVNMSTDEELLVFAKTLLASILDFPDWIAWQQQFSVEHKHEFVQIPRTESDQWRWLLRQVAPAFQKDYEDNGSWDMLDKFVEAVKQSRREVG